MHKLGLILLSYMVFTCDAPFAIVKLNQFKSHHINIKSRVIQMLRAVN